jgi:1,4-dihydroxy-2-naphthoyl-CoA hydrolase
MAHSEPPAVPTHASGGVGLPDWVDEIVSPLDAKVGLELLEVGPDRVVARLPIEGNTQPMGLLHGGANALLVETVGSMGAWAVARDRGMLAVGVDLNVTHLRSATTGYVYATGVPLRTGQTTSVWHVSIADEQHRTTAVGRITCQLITPR